MRKLLFALLILASPLCPAMAKNAEEAKWMAQAAKFFQQGEYQAAIDCYGQAVQANPHSARAYQGMGLAYVQLQQFPKALEAFEQALFLNPNLAQAHYGLGVVYPIVKRDKKKAIWHYKMYLKLRPNAPDAQKVWEWIEHLTLTGTVKRDEVMVALYNRGVEAYDRGQFEQAAEFYRKAMERNPHYAPNHHALGLAYVRIGRYRDAAAQFQECLQINPRHVEAHYDLGVVYPIFKQFDKAIFHYTQYLKIYPEAKDAAEVQSFIAKLKAQKKALGGAQEVAFYNEGVRLYNEKKYAEALRAYQEALKIQPVLEDALYGLGLALLQLRQYRPAYDALQGARKINPSNPENYYSLGVLHTLMGDPVSGVASYQKYLELSPDAPDREKVEEWIEKLMSRLDVGFFNRGIAYYDAKNYDKALESFHSALQYNPDFDEAQRMIGFVYVQKKNFPAALEALEKTLRMSPESPETHYALGVANTLLGNVAKAAQHYEKYKELSPDAQDREKVEEWIGKLKTVKTSGE